nr:EAL domain-containing protein [Octadecabacter sp. B2R22]
MLYRTRQHNSRLRDDLRRAQRDMVQTLNDSEHYKLACENAPDGIVIQDMQARILWANDSYCHIHGLSREEVIGLNPLEHALPDGNKLSAKEVAEFRFDPKDPKWDSYELVENQRADGTLFWNQISVSFVKTADGQENAILVCRDVTKQVDQQSQLHDISQRLEQQATHDAMTGVPNRGAFLDFIENALVVEGRAPVGLLHIDLDNFKDINDTHGHSAGDAVLIHAANVIQDNIRKCDLVARVGGDEFVVVCPQTTDLVYLKRFSQTIIKAISEPFEWMGRILQVHASIGAALSHSQPSTAGDLLVHSDFALYEAKRSGRNQVVLYDEDLHARHSVQLRHALDLAEAIDAGTLDFYFQPTMDIATQQIVGMETLVRWQHPEDGIILPDDFLPIVKDLGHMGALDLLAMEAALSEKARLNEIGLDHLKVAFNASPELLTHPDFVNRLVWGVEAANINRAQITIEVLENTNFGDVAETTSHAAIISDLRKAGFQVHLDDFGVGFAGLSHLASLDVSGVKIDRSLIGVLLEDSASRKIVRKIVELANDLGLTVIAEGVEDVETARALQNMGCRIIQGYWLSRPLSIEALHNWLRDTVENAPAQHA